MKFYHIGVFVLLLSVVVQARRRGRKGRKPFDLAGFLQKVFETANTKRLPQIGSISAPAIGSLGTKAEKCEDWADWCKNYKPYCSYAQVQKHCKDTCGLCPKPTITTKCEDLHTSCDLGINYGYCDGTPNQVSFMKKYCQKSCKFCGNVAKPCKNKKTDSYCNNMLEQGYCKKAQYRVFFKENCEKTCGFCEGSNHKHTCGVAHQRENDKNKPLVGGRNAKKGYYPWQAAIYYNSASNTSPVFICGGTLINKRYILTAAHCFNGRSKDVRKYKVVLGDHNREYIEDTEVTYYVDQIKIHKGYSSSHDDHDITLLKLVRQVEYTDHIYPACLPAENSQPAIGSKCYISGWGKISFDGDAVNILQELKVPIADNSKCTLRNAFNLHVVTNRMICTGYDDGANYSSGCHGDSGGPLACERSPGVWTVDGVVSWGSPLCNGLDRYTVFSRVSSYKTWIDQNAV